jgi:hypothetical protein
MVLEKPSESTQDRAQQVRNLWMSYGGLYYHSPGGILIFVIFVVELHARKLLKGGA